MSESLEQETIEPLVRVMCAAMGFDLQVYLAWVDDLLRETTWRAHFERAYERGPYG